jgi:hypothetical protein
VTIRRTPATILPVAFVRVRSFPCPLCEGPATVVERATVDAETQDVLGWTTRSVECEAGCDLGPTDVPLAG